MTSSPGRIVGIIAGTLAILTVGVYAPAMLLGPLPAVAIEVDDRASGAPADAAAIPMPADGSSALAVVADDGAVEPIATGGVDEVLPIGGAAKIVTVLATVDSLPLPPPTDGDGPGIPIGPADFTDYLRYSGEGSRALQVSPGETWSQRDVIRAILRASSNNHADTLARWAFGSVEAYVDEANAWLAAEGFANTRVADATGLSGDNVGTASEIAALAGRLVADPGLQGVFDESGGLGVNAPRAIPDVVEHLETEGVRAVSRAFTDQAGLCFVFTSQVDVEGDEPRTLVGAVLRMPDYDTLDPAVIAMVDGAAAAAQPVELIAQDASYGQAVAPWGDRSDLVASVGRTAAGWGLGETAASVDVDAFTTAPAGREVGRVVVTTADGEVASPLALAEPIRDPGPLWRLTHPFDLIGAFAADG